MTVLQPSCLFQSPSIARQLELRRIWSNNQDVLDDLL